MQRLRAHLVAQLEEVGGRHDEPAIYAGAPGDPGLAGGPDSMSWEINSDLASVAVAGPAAIVMEVLHASVMAGVFTQSSYRTQPLERARNTLGYVLRTTFGTTEAATAVIDRVRRVHSHVGGVTPDGRPYQALDPDLLAWVHTCIPWAIMTAFDRYARPLSTDEKNRYLAEQAVIGRMGGADRVPETVDELDDYVARVRPLLAVNEQTRSFLAFLAGDDGEHPPGLKARFDGWDSLHGSMQLMPAWARRLTGTHHADPVTTRWLAASNRMKVKLVRWAYPTLPCAAMARERAGAPGLRSTVSAAASA